MSYLILDIYRISEIDHTQSGILNVDESYCQLHAMFYVKLYRIE